MTPSAPRKHPRFLQNLLQSLLAPIFLRAPAQSPRAGLPKSWPLIRLAARTARSWARTAFNRPEEHTSELQSLMRISYAVFCLKKKKLKHRNIQENQTSTLQNN